MSEIDINNNPNFDISKDDDIGGGTATTDGSSE